MNKKTLTKWGIIVGCGIIAALGVIKILPFWSTMLGLACYAGGIATCYLLNKWEPTIKVETNKGE